MFRSLSTPSKTNKGQAMVEYLLVTTVFVIIAGIAVKLVGSAMGRYFGFLIACISLPIP